MKVPDTDDLLALIVDLAEGIAGGSVGATCRWPTVEDGLVLARYVVDFNRSMDNGGKVPKRWGLDDEYTCAMADVHATIRESVTVGEQRLAFNEMWKEIKDATDEAVARFKKSSDERSAKMGATVDAATKDLRRRIRE